MRGFRDDGLEFRVAGTSRGKTVCILHIHMSYSLNSLKGDI